MAVVGIRANVARLKLHPFIIARNSPAGRELPLFCQNQRGMFVNLLWFQISNLLRLLCNFVNFSLTVQTLNIGVLLCSQDSLSSFDNLEKTFFYA